MHARCHPGFARYAAGCTGVVRARRQNRRWASIPLVWLVVVTLGIAQTALLGPELLAKIQDFYGVEARLRVDAWSALMLEQRGVSDREKLHAVNRFFNEMNFISDDLHWGADDYWATPIEFLATQGGDCEDFAVAKYFTLRELGVPDDRMRLTYVKALELNQAHMVLTYAESPQDEPVVLDNLTAEILPASVRDDLLPVYSFNGDGLWLAKRRGRGELMGGSDRISRWSDLVQRIKESRMRRARE